MDPLYSSNQPDPLADLRAFVDCCPEGIHKDNSELARILCCSQFEVEEARRWMLEDGLEVRA